MKPRHGATYARCKAEVTRLAKLYPDVHGSIRQLTDVLKTWAVNDNHAKEIVDQLLFAGRTPNSIAIRDTAERLRARGPKRCPHCSGTGYVIVERNGTSGAERCQCRQPRAENQGALFGENQGENLRKGVRNGE